MWKPPIIMAAPQHGGVPTSSFQVGAIRVHVIQDGMLRPDASHFFDAERVAALHALGGLDDQSKVRLSVHCLVVSSGDRLAILDTGLGLGDNSPSTPNIFGSRGRLLPELERLGVDPKQVDAVVLSHGHADHVGGNVAGGVPGFPRARYFIGAADFHHFTSDDVLSTMPFYAEQLQLLADRERLEPTDGELEVIPGVRILPTPGHTPGHIAVGLTSGGEHGLYVGDLLHHPIQVENPTWSPLFDWMPEMSARARQATLERARAERALVFTAHFAFPGVGRLAERWVGGA